MTLSGRAKIGPLVALAFVVAAALPSATTTPSLAQLEAAIKSSAGATKVPNLNTTVPPLLSLAGAGDAPAGINYKCYTEQGATAVPPNASSICTWGDKSSKETLYLFGDSQATMWLNTFAPVLSQLKWRVVETAQTGCPPWPDQTAVSESGEDESSCIAWDESELALEKDLKPQMVVAIGDGFHVGKGVYATSAQLKKGAMDLVKAVAPAKVLFLSPIPMYSTDQQLPYATPTDCLSVASSLKSCDYSPQLLVQPTQYSAWMAVAKAEHDHFLDITDLFCTTKICPVIVDDKGERLVYLDASHATKTYMTFIEAAFKQMLKPDL